VDDGFVVNVETLVAVATQLEGAGTGLRPAGAELDGPARTASAVNRGFLTSEAVVELAGAWQQAVARISGSLDNHGHTLRSNAQAYQETDSAAHDSFKATE
jgi:uncharacterized protein YukE